MNSSGICLPCSSEFGGTQVLREGVRIGDEMVIRPLFGRSRKLALNRTKYRICSDPHGQAIQIEGNQIFLPSSGEKFDLELDLLPSRKGDTAEDERRYILRAINGVPFKVNGTYSFATLVERGDLLDICFNRLSFEFPVGKGGEVLGFEQKWGMTTHVAESELDVLIQGETGTGKSTLAEAIHNESGRSGNFVHLNLSGMPEGLIESELFGHVKGAFTGAIKEKRGAALDANRGTLFLDEIDSLALHLQTKLLLFLESKRFRPVGSDQEISSEVRLIYASGRSLHQLVKEGEFRKDLYFRVSSGVKSQLLPLRENSEKIKEIVESFCLEKNVRISSDLLKHYYSLNWPGNIRQLCSHLQRKVISSKGTRLIMDQCDSELASEDFEMLEKVNPKGEFLPLEMIKLEYAFSVFSQLKGNIKKTSEVLQITPATLRNFLRKRENGSVFTHRSCA